MSLQQAAEHLREGRPQVAIAILEGELLRQPASAQGWFLLGACHDALRQFRAAVDAFSYSLRLDPARLEAHLARITVLRGMGRPSVALTACRQALKHFPEDARVLCATAICLEDLGQESAALAQYDSALQFAPTYADALHNRGLLLARLGRLDDAEANLRAFIYARPDDLRAYTGHADILLALGRFAEALNSIDAADGLQPRNPGVQVRRGVALAALRQFDLARAQFSELQDRDPTGLTQYLHRVAPGSHPEYMLSPESIFLWQCHLAQKRCEWKEWTAASEELLRAPLGAPPLEPAVAFIAFHQALNGRERSAVARHISANIERRNSPLPPPPIRCRNRIRIGVLSPDLRDHLNAYLLFPLFQLLDRERFELFAYSLTASDGSVIHAKLISHADRFRELHTLSDRQAALAIRQDDVDILIDAAGHTAGGRVAVTLQRPARIQALYLGFAGSLGSTRVDYSIVDRIVGCDTDEWTETLIHLPNTYYLYDFRDPISDARVSRFEYELPENTFVFCAFHKAEKISPDAFDLWMQILARVQCSTLWLLALPNLAQRNLRHEAFTRGIDPSRLVFAPFDPRDRYLARQCLGDLMLDAIHHSAMTTACDAMAAGLPVLTILGDAMASRSGASLARAAGVPEMIARDKDDYVEKAVFLAQNPEELHRTRQKLLARTGPLFDTPGRVRELEQAFLEMWRRYEQRQ